MINDDESRLAAPRRVHAEFTGARYDDVEERAAGDNVAR